MLQFASPINQPHPAFGGGVTTPTASPNSPGYLLICIRAEALARGRLGRDKAALLAHWSDVSEQPCYLGLGSISQSEQHHLRGHKSLLLPPREAQDLGGPGVLDSRMSHSRSRPGATFPAPSQPGRGRKSANVALSPDLRCRPVSGAQPPSTGYRGQHPVTVRRSAGLRRTEALVLRLLARFEFSGPNVVVDGG